jgi:hypothetical protein
MWAGRYIHNSLKCAGGVLYSVGRPLAVRRAASLAGRFSGTSTGPKLARRWNVATRGDSWDGGFDLDGLDAVCAPQAKTCIRRTLVVFGVKYQEPAGWRRRATSRTSRTNGATVSQKISKAGGSLKRVEAVRPELKRRASRQATAGWCRSNLPIFRCFIAICFR